jgi:class 3 adenylate cyclase/tetratricopeptide (TPR) repeat protein
VVCTSCGAENRDGAKFCVACGHTLGLACATCGSPYEAGDRFCAECGAALQAAPTPAVPVTERRVVSVLFADLVGFTTLSESRDAEDVRDLLSRYFETCRRLIELYGGTVEKFIGDAVMAVWGTPTATEDDAERAVRAALELVAAVSGLGVDGLQARAGVLTGEAAVNLAAVGEGMVAGDLVNTAARVQSVAEPGSVLVGETTRRASERAIAYEAAGSFELKGKEGETRLWRALRVVSGRGGSLKSEGLEAPFVGRERELRQIKDLFHSCADAQRAQLVSVTGIAGIGKSRLAWEFYKYFDGLKQVVYWHRGRCLAYGEGVTYWALADMVRMRCRIAEDEAPEDALAKLRTALEEHILDAEERRFMEPNLAQLLGLGGQEAGDRQELFATWRLFFERLSETYPTVLVFEDMQWADSSLLDFVEYLLEWSRNHPLYVITLARPELHERRPTWGAGHRNFVSLYLEPLTEGAMTELLDGLVPGLPATLQSQILQRAEGVPLYAVETVRMLLDRGLLVADGASYAVVGEMESLEVPETLQALVAARLDGLSAEERRLVQDAAVLGRTFTPGSVAVLTGRAPQELEPLLAGLVRKELLGVQSDPRSPEHGQYGFLQDIVRHVAYETLPRRERRARHLAAAEHLASALGEDEVAEVIASHLLEAYRLDPRAEDAAALRVRACAALVRAGERAASLAAGSEGQHYYEQALELVDDPREQAELHEQAGRMARLAGRLPEAEAHFERAIELLEVQGRTHAAARVRAALGDTLFFQERLADALAATEQAFAALEHEERDPDLATLAAQLGRLLMVAGRPDEALARNEVALEVAEALELPEVLSHALNTKGALLERAGRRQEGWLLVRHSLDVALRHDLFTAALRAYNNLSAMGYDLDRIDEAVEASRAGLALARRVGDRVNEFNFRCGLVGALIALARWDEAEPEIASLVEVQPWPAFFSVPIHLRRGEIADARRAYEAALPHRDPAHAESEAAYFAAEAQILRAEGRPLEALASAERALAFADRIAVTSYGPKVSLDTGLAVALELGDEVQADTLLRLIEAVPPGHTSPRIRAIGARYSARREDDATADASFAAAEQLYRSVPAPLELAETQVEHAEWLLEHGRAEDAEPLLAEARATFEPLRATPWLERIDNASLQFAAVSARDSGSSSRA